jgi:hypothetical protein
MINTDLLIHNEKSLHTKDCSKRLLTIEQHVLDKHAGKQLS